MENYEIGSLREWAPLTDVLEKIPARIQKGLFPQNLNITAVYAVPEFIALGTDAGVVFWYNRQSGEIQKLRNEGTSSITCLRIVSSVEYMVAAGNVTGQVNVFQIQKELPPNLNLVAPLTKAKPIERYTIRDLHKGPVTCCEWSKNGMKLFSGDKQGVVVLTEFDYQTHLSKSTEILNEAYDIVQLSLSQSYLLVSTVYRSIICFREKNGRWQVLQVGKKDRKFLSAFGGTFCDASKKTPTIICSRPGLRFWLADSNGNVQQTLLFKEAITKNPEWEIPLLNPSKSVSTPLQNFNRVLMFSKKFVVTYDSTKLYILNLEKLRVEACSQTFRGIFDVSVCDKEIFVLEGPRSLIRISSSPEPPNKTAKIIFNPLMPPPVPAGLNFKAPIEFEAEEEAVINAEECFELPPIQHLDLDIPIESNLDSPTTKQTRLLVEQNRRIEVFDRINEMGYEDSILYRSGANRRHKKDSSTCKGHSSKKKVKGGIVEIGHAMVESASSPNDTDDKKVLKQELTTRPFSMDVSFVTDSSLLPDMRSPDTLKRLLEPKERALAESLNLEPVKLVEMPETTLKTSTHGENHLPILQYPIKYPITDIGNAADQTTPIKRIHFITDETKNESPEFDACEKSYDEKICDNLKNVMIKSDCASCSSFKQSAEYTKPMTKSLQFVTGPIVASQQPISPGIPDVQSMPAYMKIPSLWNVTIENVDAEDQSDSQLSGDWEIVDD